MPYNIDNTHDPKLESWVESANDPETDFPIQNLPYCIADDLGFCVAIGDKLIPIENLVYSAIFEESAPDDLTFLYDVVASETILSGGARLAFRRYLVDILRKDNPVLRDNREWRAALLHNRKRATLDLPEYNIIGDYTDFYASLYHATNVGTMFRPDNPLLPNYKHIPVGYHGRASSIVPSGTPITRPTGQAAPVEEGATPGFGPCKLLDYELEIGAFVARGNELGQPIDINNAEDHVLGLCLLNDWSARDIQKWEYQPLGPFLAKNFASTISPYIVTMEALAPFRCPAFERSASDPQPLPYLNGEYNNTQGGFDITLEVHLQSAEMKKRGLSPVRLSTGNFKDMYWTVAQMVTHHTVNGCNLQSGDLLGSGTVSGPNRKNRGCLLELTWDGDPWAEIPRIAPGTQRTPVELPTGEKRTFLADGDEVIITGYCEREGFRRIGFGECRGIIQPAH